MKTLLMMTLALLAAIFLPVPGEAMESMAEIQSALDRAEPGSILEIPGGTYFGTLHTTRSGEPGKPITLRPKAGEVVILNAGHKLAGPFSPVEGEPGVWKGSAPPIPEQCSLWEMPSHLRLRQVTSRQQCIERLASWFYDAATGELWVHPIDNGSVEYWVEALEPVIQIAHSHYRLERLHTTLGGHGIVLEKQSAHVTVEACHSYCNRSAGIHLSGVAHRVIGNEASRNNMYGIQCRTTIEGAYIAGNLCLQNGPANEETTDTSEPTDLGIYSRGAYNLFERNIAIGFTKNAYRNKYAVNSTTLFRRNVVAGYANPAQSAVVENTFIVDGPGPRAGMYINNPVRTDEAAWESADPGGSQRADNLIYPAWRQQEPLFCDPAYHDYRLQAGSPYRGQGAEPGIAPVYYIDPARGSDAMANGRSASQPLASIAEAVRRAPAGATLYLLPGTYSETLLLTAGGFPEEPLRFRAWGRSEEVIVTGEWRIEGALGAKMKLNESPGGNQIEVEGITFSEAPLRASRTLGLTLRNCRFEGAASGLIIDESEGVHITKCDFIRTRQAVRIKNGSRQTVVQSRFSSVTEAFVIEGEAVLYAEYNRYAETPPPAWPQGSRNDRFSLSLADERERSGLPLGPGFQSAGMRREKQSGALQASELKIAGLAPEAATLLWRVDGLSPSSEVLVRPIHGGEERRFAPHLQFQIMGPYFDLSFSHNAFFEQGRHFPLTGLQPGTEYEASVAAHGVDGGLSKALKIRFKTPSAPPHPRTFYIAPGGSDTADGNSKATAWQSFRHAVTQLAPGDSLIALDGVYKETIRPIISGTKEAPITIQAENRGAAIIDLSGGLTAGAILLYTHHLHLDGLLFRSGSQRSGFSILIDHSHGARITFCEMDYPEGSSFEKPKGAFNGLVANDAPDILIEDNLFLCNIIHIGLANSPGATLRHNTIVGEGNYGVVIVPGSASEEYLVENNLFYRAIMGYKQGGIFRVSHPLPRLSADHNLFYIPEEHQGGIANWPDPERLVTLAQWQEKTGQDTRSLTVAPRFVAPEQRDFTLAADSPGRGAARDGTDIGRRPSTGAHSKAPRP